ncbi:MAG: hypothetical protein ABJA67_09960 [Chthonomonadales bacterium]
MKLAELLVVTGLLGVVSGSAHSQISSTPDGHLFRLKLVKGATFNYQLTSSAEGVKLVAPVKFTYTNVAGDVADVSVTSGPAMINGASQAPANTSKAKINSMGKPIGKDVDSLGSIAGVIFPARRMKVGESISQTIPVNFGSQALKVTTVHKFLGDRKVGIRRAAAFKVTVSATGKMKVEGENAILSVNGTGTKLFDVTDGHLLSSNISQTITTKSKDKKMSTTNVVEIIRK